jgi:hypothetical protein
MRESLPSITAIWPLFTPGSNGYLDPKRDVHELLVGDTKEQIAAITAISKSRRETASSNITQNADRGYKTRYSS